MSDKSPSPTGLELAPSLFGAVGPRVYNIPPAASFLDVLAKGLLAELDRPDAPFALSDAIILLPTKRAARALGQAFLDARGGMATLLPRIRTLGDIDPDDAGLAELGEGLDATPVIDPMSRRLILARLIRARDKQADWSDDPLSALQAADALADLLDGAAMMASADTPFDWAALETLVSEKDLAQHWQHATTFLKIITDVWPQYLDSVGRVDPGVRQRRGIESLMENWAARPPKGAVILAGSTGSMPITRALMACVARLERGCVVFPGLDLDLADEKWAQARIEDQHPQHAMAQALAAIGVDRAQVQPWPDAQETRPLRYRRIVLNEALTPQESTADWPSRIKAIGPYNIALGLSGLSLVEAANDEEEARIIALELRETLEHSDQTAALITPDANIARRVAAKLARWNIAIDMSAGRPLSDTSVGSFVRLIADWAVDPADPVSLSSVLNHPLTGLGHSPSEVRKWAAHLEINLLRGARKDGDLAGLLTRTQGQGLKHWRAPSGVSAHNSRQSICDLLGKIIALLQASGPLAGSLDQGTQCLVSLCEAFATTDTESGAQILWRGEVGEVASSLLTGLITHGAQFETLDARNLARIISAMLGEKVVRPRGTHPRLAILGPLEARLLRFDKIVLAGLDEGIWPKPPAPDPFLSRTMRNSLGLPAADARIGLSAHDFSQLAGAPSVILTHAARRADSPTIMSRWLWRLTTLARGALGAAGAHEVLTSSDNWQSRLRAFEPVRAFDPSHAIPAPKPPVDARPHTFSATQIETWIRDPYRIYVEKILGLRALDPLGGKPGVSERGSAIHAGLEIIDLWHRHRPQDPLADLRGAIQAQLAQAGFVGFDLRAEMARMDNGLKWLAAREMARLDAGFDPFVEKWGECQLQTSAGIITLKAKADRIDVGPLGVEILDFKTGKPPEAKEVREFSAPQLPVTALILAKGGFAGIRAQMPTDLVYSRLGGRNFGAVSGIRKDSTVESLVKRMEDTITRLFITFADPDFAYRSKPRMSFLKKTTYDDPTDRLARRAEWANADDDE